MNLVSVYAAVRMVYHSFLNSEDQRKLLNNFNLQMIIPAHCTGWRAVNALGNEVVVPSAVGRL